MPVSDEAYERDGSFYQGVAKESTGYKLMQSLGWKEGEGLGAKKQGIREHVKVKKKFDNAGVGKSEADARVRDWTLGMAAFDRVLSSLMEITSKHGGRGSGGSASGDGEQSDASGGAGAAANGSRRERKRRRADSSTANREPASKKPARRGEWAAATATAAGGKAEKGGSEKRQKRRNKSTASAAEPAVQSSDGGSASSGGEDNRPAPSRRAVTHVGRFKRREASKAVRSYSSADLAAIVGVVDNADGGADAFFKAPAALGMQRARSSGEDASSSGDEDENASADNAGLGAARRAEQTNGAGGSGGAGTALDLDGKPVWWSSYFLRAGQLGAAGRVGRRSSKGCFTEDDQVALYNMNKEAERCGRQGLGVKRLPPKVAGARWKGTKVKLGSGSDGEVGADIDGDAPHLQGSASAVNGSEHMSERDAVRRALGGIEASGIVILPPKRLRQADPGLPPGKQQQRQPGSAAEAATKLCSKDGKTGGQKKRKKEHASGGQGHAGRPAAAATAAVASAAAAAACQQQQPPPQKRYIRWKKVAAGVLQGAPGGSMRLGKLQRRTLRAAGLPADSAVGMGKLLKALSSSSRFVVEGKAVRLQAAGVAGSR